MGKINIYMILDEENRIVKYSSEEISDISAYLSTDQIKSIIPHRTGFIDGKIVDLGYSNEKLLEINNNELREKRKFLLKAFDIWEKAVLRGREQDSQTIMNWYQGLLDLNPESFNNVPLEIKYYLGIGEMIETQE